MKNISQPKIKSLQLDLPPIDEQRRIADMLDRVDMLLARVNERTRSLKALLDARREALIVATGDWSVMPHGWELLRLDEVVDLRLGFTKGRKLTGPTTQVPYLRAANVHNGNLRLDDVKTEAVLVTETAKWALAPGDLLLIEGGNPEDLGRGWIWEDQIHPCLHQNSVFRGRVKRHEVVPRFLAYAITSTPARRYCEGSAIQTSNIAHIGTARLAAMPIAIPPEPEQTAIAEELDIARAAWIASGSEFTSLTRLREGLLVALISGIREIPSSYDGFLESEATVV